MMGDSKKRALSGIRILDFSQMMLGPLCTQMLGDLGADVIKVERPEEGEWMRKMPVAGRLIGNSSPAFHAFNRNKRSIAVDLKSEQGRALLLKLAVHCDVVTENFRAGVMDRLGLGYDAFKAVKPDIIYASGSGWGQDSELAKLNRPGQDLLIQAMSGVMFNTGRSSDPPTPCGTPVADYAASQSMAVGILTALIGRDRYGIGQRVEVDLYSSLMNAMSQENFAILNQKVDLKRAESGIATCWNDAPYGTYQTADSWIVIAMCPLPKLGALIGAQDISEWDAWSERDRVKRRVEREIRLRPSAEWLRIFQEADVWSAPVRTSREAMDELMALGTRGVVSFEHRTAGTLNAIACPVTLSEMPADTRYPSPLVGEHTEEIILEILGATTRNEEVVL